MSTAGVKQRYRDAWKADYPKDAGMRGAASENVCRHLLASDAFRLADKVALFHPLPWEPDLGALWEARPGACAFPRADGPSRGMSFHFVPSLASLVRGYAGIKEPPDEPGNRAGSWGKRDLVLVPGYAFDLWGGRVGSGLGFYDRFLAGVAARKIGVCFQAQITNDKLAQDQTDVRMDGLCTELGLTLSLKAR